MNSQARRELSGSNWLCLFLVCMVAPAMHAQQSAAVSAKVIAWAAQNIGPYNTYHAYAQHKQQPQVPVPPMVDPPCHVCGDTTKTQGETQVANWVAQSEEPENTYIQGLLAMDKFIQTVGGSGSDILTPQAQKALRQFEDDAGFMSDAAAIASELVNQKAVPMAQKYDKEPKQAYAGISFLLATAKVSALLGNDASHTTEDQVLQYAEQWEQSISDKIQNDVLSGHKYNLCPVYSSIVRQVVLLGGQEPQDMDKYEQMLKKLQDLVKFNVNITLKADTTGSDGSYLHVGWTGKAKLTLQLDLSNSCYTPQFDNNGQMAVNVTNFSAQGMETRPDGSKQPIPMTLTSSHSYNVTLGTPQVNLCDPQPIFQMPEPTSVPTEQITAKGHTANTGLFGPFMASVIAPNEINSANTNAVTGQTPSLPGGSQSSGSGTSGSGSSGTSQAQQQINAHKGDVNWLMSAEGQAAIAALQSQLLGTVQNKIAAAGVVVPNASSFAQLGASLGSAHLPWTNGQSQPVNKTLHTQKDTTNITLKVTVQQAQ